jgi:transcription antitermination factor NusG
MGITAKTAPENHLSDTEERWFAIRTRFRDEKMALKMLTLQDIHAYLPMRKLARRYTRKIRYVELPLINSFLFVRILHKDYSTVLQTQYVTGFLKFGQNLLSIPDEEINWIKRLLNEDIEIEVTTTDFSKGDLVEVNAGPLLGLKGRLVEMQGKDKILVDLSNSGHTIHITIDKKLLSKLSS